MANQPLQPTGRGAAQVCFRVKQLVSRRLTASCMAAALLGCSSVKRQETLQDSTLGGFVRAGLVSVLWVDAGRSQTMEGYAGQHLGRALFAIGDVNADGVHDIISAAERAATHDSRQLACRVSALSGSDGSELWTWRGLGTEDIRNITIVATGDLDSDSVEDIAVGDADRPSEKPVVILSARDGSELQTVDLAAQQFEFRSNQPATQVALDIPDTDGDGWNDRLVGELVDAGHIGGNRGRATLISGASGATIRDFDEPHYDPLQLPGGMDLRSGASLRLFWGDIDGDRHGDVVLVVTSTFFPWTITAFSGDGGGILLYARTGKPDSMAHWWGAVALPGDLDGDGRDDLVLGLDLPGAMSSVLALRTELSCKGIGEAGGAP